MQGPFSFPFSGIMSADGRSASGTWTGTVMLERQALNARGDWSAKRVPEPVPLLGGVEMAALSALLLGAGWWLLRRQRQNATH